MNFTIISVGTHENKNFIACKSILDDQQCIFTYQHIFDGKRAMKLSRGHMNPSGGFVILAPDEEVLLNYFDLVKWIEKHGLRQI